PPAAGLPAALPRNQTLSLGTGQAPPAQGSVEDLSKMTSTEYIAALETLREVDAVNIVSIPDASNVDTTADPSGFTVVQQAMIAHCEQLADRFAVLDALPPAPDQPLFGTGSVEGQRPGL